eukprot:gnl/MRDRNA2_/MRDRNA2_166691_c0_seq1.p1 gnl/MRDRNA2_/MRDRNA2_166691_c0~~gnl/MRDRNA2_/MRDRNA2_166691_c0_seq1.p1  ORF type:complete len:534 (-),score=106.39 gnl/MRDRNA2_/MRDRNA2_166691_c0_seq1:149-1684(-)
MRAAMAHWCTEYQERSSSGKVKIWQPQFVYFRSSDEFPLVEEFVFEAAKRHSFNVDVLDCGWMEGLKKMTLKALGEPDSTSASGVSTSLAFVLGTRVGDPNCGNQQAFAPSSLGMKGIKPFMRVNPILDWTYGDVWQFLRQFELTYCSLYDEGYSSLGKRCDTEPNPALQRPDGTYAPAYTLTDWSQERSGRASKKPAAKPQVEQKNSKLTRKASNASISSMGSVALGAEGGTAGLVIIGDEVLKGQVSDTNTPFAARLLRSQGVALRRVSVIPDTEKEIVNELRSQSTAFDVVFTSGGLGPTHDDITLKSVASAFDMELEANEEMLELLRARAGKTGATGGTEPEDAAMLRQAQLPKGAVLRTPPESADGEKVWPVLQCRNVFVLPGVPRVFEQKVKTICDHFLVGALGRPHTRRILLSVNEEKVAQIVEDTAESLRPKVKIGSYPVEDDSQGEVHTIITLESRCEQAVEGAVQHLLSRIDSNMIVRVDQGDVVSSRPSSPVMKPTDSPK